MIRVIRGIRVIKVIRGMRVIRVIRGMRVIRVCTYSTALARKSEATNMSLEPKDMAPACSSLSCPCAQRGRGERLVRAELGLLGLLRLLVIQREVHERDFPQ